MKNIERRLDALTAKVTSNQRNTLGGLVALVESGNLGMQDLTDLELERLIVGLPGDGVDIRILSDAELEAVING